MRSLAKLGAVAAVAAIYAATGAIGAVLSPSSARSGAELAAYAGGALAVFLVPALFLARAIGRRKPERPKSSIVLAVLTGWGAVLVAGAAAAPGRGERFLWPARSLLATIAPSAPPSSPAVVTPPAPSASPASVAPPAPSSAPAVVTTTGDGLHRGSARVDGHLEGGLPGAAPVLFRHVAAWPERNGIAVALSDRPVRCGGFHQDAGFLLTATLAPDLDGTFHPGREVAVGYRVQPFSRRDPRGGVFVKIDPFEVKAGAAIRGRIRFDFEIDSGVDGRLVGAGDFDAVLCEKRHDGPEGRPGDPVVGDYLQGWRSAPKSDGELAGTLLGQPFVGKFAVARTRTGRDGKAQLRSIRFSQQDLGCGDPGREVAVQLGIFGEVAGPTTGAVPASVSAQRPGAATDPVLSGENGLAVIDIARFDEGGSDVVGHVAAWSSAPKSDRTTEVAGRFQARICADPR